jgi:hypothetical protein
MRAVIIVAGLFVAVLSVGAQEIPPSSTPSTTTKSGSAVDKSNGQAKVSKTEEENSGKSLEATCKECSTCCPVEQPQGKSREEQAKADSLDRLYRHYMWATIIGAVGALIGVAVLIWQTILSRRSSERQLRAYVVCESASIYNVANPIPIFNGQVFTPTGAEIGNPGAGPGAVVNIKNTGQTPAYEVVHWANICFREYPLVASLPARIPGDGKFPTAILGSGVTSIKLLPLNPRLTDLQIASLRAGTEVVYVYGEITYKDAFGKGWSTRYRCMYHPMGGAIGVSTTLNFCEEGNTGS